MLKGFVNKSDKEIMLKSLSMAQGYDVNKAESYIKIFKKYKIYDNVLSLFKVGYAPYLIEQRDDVNINIRMQRRVDTIYRSLPLCESNDRVFVNSCLSIFDTGNIHSINVEFEMVHATSDENWIELKPYGIPLKSVLTEQDVIDQEKKLVTLWTYAHAIYNNNL